MLYVRLLQKTVAFMGHSTAGADVIMMQNCIQTLCHVM